MEISLEAIISLVSLFVGGSGLGIFFTWRYAKRRAAADAKLAEATAKEAESNAEKARIEANKEMQALYQQMINDVKADREDLRQDRNRVQKRVGQLTVELDEIKRVVARQGRILDCMRPFLCSRQNCPDRILITLPELMSGNGHAESAESAETAEGGPDEGGDEEDEKEHS